MGNRLTRLCVVGMVAYLYTTGSMPSWLSWQRVSIAAVLLASFLIRQLYIHQDSLLYHPKAYPEYIRPRDNPEPLRHPGEWSIPYEDEMILTKDGIKIHAWFMKHPDPRERPTMIYFQGNAGNMGFRLHNLSQFYLHLGVNILAVSYRGYGDSEGNPSESGIQLDAEAALKFLLNHPDIDPKKIVLFGRSLGGAVSVYLASKFPDQIGATIIENSFTSISDMVDRIFPFLIPIKRYILKIDWGSDRRIERISHPMLFISGLKDELVPPVHMQKLFDLATNSRNREMLKIPDGTHNETWRIGGARYLNAIRKFLLEIAFPGQFWNGGVQTVSQNPITFEAMANLKSSPL